jgi:hypothetical protein
MASTPSREHKLPLGYREDHDALQNNDHLETKTLVDLARFSNRYEATQYDRGASRVLANSAKHHWLHDSDMQIVDFN